MDTNFRNQLIAEYARPDEVVWAGVVAEMGGQWLVHALWRDPSARSTSTTRTIAGRTVSFNTHSIERTDFLANSPASIVDLLNLPISGSNLVGRPPLDLLAPRMNAHRIPGALAGSISAAAYQWALNVHVRGGLTSVNALKVRALYAYLAEHDEVPTQEAFNRFVLENEAPWAVALCAETRGAADLAPGVLHAAGITQAAVTTAFRSMEWLDHWAGERGPSLGGRFAPQRTQPAQSREIQAPPPPPFRDDEDRLCRATSSYDAPSPGWSGILADLRY